VRSTEATRNWKVVGLGCWQRLKEIVKVCSLETQRMPEEISRWSKKTKIDGFAREEGASVRWKRPMHSRRWLTVRLCMATAKWLFS